MLNLYRKGGKRGFDFLVSLLGLIFLSPLFFILALFVKIGSKGPVFFVQERVGQFGKLFRLYKFRSMVVDADQKGLGITSRGDQRITSIGKFLRRNKLDELPQLLNVLKGDMSFVGPRPEIKKYVDLKKDDYTYLLTTRPGITDPATLAYREEELILSQFEDKELGYIQQVLPHKIQLSRQYVQDIRFLNDLKLIVRTVF